MYRSLWRILPGPLWCRILLAIVGVAGVLAALVTWVFPWIGSNLGIESGVVAVQ
jgi:hypothetical protein